jgi:hypothetical protein
MAQRKNGRARESESDSLAVAELDALKRLLMLLLVKLGATSDEIAMVLKVDASGVRRIVPSRGIKRIVRAGIDQAE